MDLGNLFGGINAQQIEKVIDLVTNNQDALQALGRLPEFFEKFADALEGAGEQAKEAAVALVGADGATGARGTLHSSSQALTQIVGSLGKGVDMIASAATSAAKVPLMDGPAQHFADAAAQMGETTNSLGELARSMEAIARTLDSVGQALAKLGAHLDDSGSQARGFLDAS